MTAKGCLTLFSAVLLLSACGKNSKDEAVTTPMPCPQFQAFMNSNPYYVNNNTAVRNYQGQQMSVADYNGTYNRCFNSPSAVTGGPGYYPPTAYVPPAGYVPASGYPPPAGYVPPAGWNNRLPPPGWANLPPRDPGFPPPVRRHPDPRYGWDYDREREPRDYDHDRDDDRK